jgi:hypothetical protein
MMFIVQLVLAAMVGAQEMPDNWKGHWVATCAPVIAVAEGFVSVTTCGALTVQTVIEPKLRFAGLTCKTIGVAVGDGLGVAVVEGVGEMLGVGVGLALVSRAAVASAGIVKVPVCPL